ncbi:MAG: 16S rRNA (cytosine(1402)-N(4))-methyltransferase RsmH [Phycisphaerae bacterium]|nr:16S rRNA (cytosine(1402)-N(4))-methyltransferase RsmH [Phycisphaerae bacterium]
MAADHLPVLIDQVLSLLAPQPGEIVVDATLGLAGHASRMLQAVGPTGLLIGLDVDPANLARAKENLAALGGDLKSRLFHANFAQLPEVLQETGTPRVNVILADLGMASTQLDDPARGFSFQAAGPLDMRLDPRLERTAADIVNRMPETPLANLLFELGGEVFSRKIARAICRRRVDARIDTTEELVAIVCASLHVDPTSRKSKIHPATRTFMALRIAVNEELENLDRLLELAPGVLAAGGRFGVISFHSLEDRRVKQSFASESAAGTYQILTKKPIQAEESEFAFNPRSRSAKLRVARRCGQ